LSDRPPDDVLRGRFAGWSSLACKKGKGELGDPMKWSERPRAHRWAIIGAFVGMAVGAVAVFEYAYHGSTFDRYIIMAGGLLIGGAIGALLSRLAR
jgi:hypothetical protein